MNNEYIRIYFKNNKRIKLYWSDVSKGNLDTDYFLKYLTKNQIKLTRTFSEIIDELGIKKINNNSLRSKTKIINDHFLWDYSYLNEKCIYTNPDFIKLYKILGFIKYIKNKKIIKAEINLKDLQSHKILCDFFINRKVSVKSNKIGIKFNLKSKIPEIFKSIILLFRYYYKNKRLIHKTSPKLKKKNIFISYFINSSNLKKNISLFWGDLPSFVEKNSKDYCFNFIDLQNTHSQYKFLSNNKNYFLKNFLNLKDIFYAVKLYLDFYIKNFNLLNKEIFYSNKLKLNLSLFFERKLVKSLYGFKSLETILIILSIKNFLKKIKPDNILYISENQSWEKILNVESKKKNIITYGIIHSLINKWDKRFSGCINKKKNEPNAFLVNGKYNKQKLEDNKILTNIIKVESLRYSFIKRTKTKNLKNNIVIYGSFDYKTTFKLLNEINKSNKIKSLFSVSLIDHPSVKKINFSKKFNFLRAYNKNESHIAVVPHNSSVIVDLILKNIPAITYEDKFSLNANYYEILSNKIKFSYVKELENILDKKSKILNKRNNFNNRSQIFINKKLPKWDKFIKKYL